MRKEGTNNVRLEGVSEVGGPCLGFSLNKLTHQTFAVTQQQCLLVSHAGVMGLGGGSSTVSKDFSSYLG